MKHSNHLHRDTTVAIQAKELLDSCKYYGKKIELYGGLLFHNNDISYVSSNNAEDIYELMFETLTQRKYIPECIHFCTSFPPNNSFSNEDRLKIAESKFHDLLKKKYSSEFLSIFQALCTIKNENIAYFLIKKFFSEKKSEHFLLEQTLLWAYRAKILNDEGYKDLISLSAIPSIYSASSNKRVYGCAYRGNNSDWKFLVNANKHVFLEEYDKLYVSNYMVTPYWFKIYSDSLTGKQVRESFLSAIEQYFTKDYLILIEVLCHLYNSNIKLLLEQLDINATYFTLEEKQLLKKYKTIFHLAF